MRPGSVFPTLVGVFPSAAVTARTGARLPHARGGVSAVCTSSASPTPSSPRSWGCFLWPGSWERARSVFPTLVGVFLGKRLHGIGPAGLPHARGGVSKRRLSCVAVSPSSPRSWGCFLLTRFSGSEKPVFPTLVGVFQWVARNASVEGGLPHARGGVSVSPDAGAWGPVSSPRSWGCFSPQRQDREGETVFPTLVGVFLRQP